MSRAAVGMGVAMLAICYALQAQLPSDVSAASQAELSRYADPDPMGGGGGGQVEYSAERGMAFSRMVLGGTVSSLGTGVALGTNLGPRLDLRLFGNYTNLTHNFSNSGFRIALNVGMANTGAMVDFYPLHRFPLRLSPGFLYFNSNRVAANLRAEQFATFTLNNVDYASDPTNPVHGTGRLLLGGAGFMATTGLGHYVSHSRKRFTFPFEAGVVFINKPVAQFNLFGNVCDVNRRFCQPAAQFPTFSTNLAAQVASWNKRVAPFHVYPILQGGVAYSFNLRRRGLE